MAQKHKSRRNKWEDASLGEKLTLLGFIALWVFLAAVTFIGICYGFLGSMIWDLHPETKNILEVVRISLTIVGGIGAVGYLVIKYQERQAGLREERRTVNQLDRRRFGEAIALFGSENTITRMTRKGIKSLNHNMQGELDKLTREKEARKLYRKWDNVKCVGDLEKSRFVPKKSYGESNWGFKIRRSTRQDSSQKDVVPFALVVTLKEMDGHNRIDEFVQRCHLQHWLVNEIDIHNYINLYQEADIELNFDDEQ